MHELAFVLFYKGKQREMFHTLSLKAALYCIAKRAYRRLDDMPVLL